MESSERREEIQVLRGHPYDAVPLSQKIFHYMEILYLPFKQGLQFLLRPGSWRASKLKTGSPEARYHDWNLPRESVVPEKSNLYKEKW